MIEPRKGTALRQGEASASGPADRCGPDHGGPDHGGPDQSNNDTLRFYRELRDLAIKSANTGSPLSLLVFESGNAAKRSGPGGGPGAGPGAEIGHSWMKTIQDSLQAGLKDCETLVACGANALFLILLGSGLEDAEKRVADINQTLRRDAGAAPLVPDSLAIGVAQRQDSEPLSHFVHRTRSALRSA